MGRISDKEAMRYAIDLYKLKTEGEIDLADSVPYEKLRKAIPAQVREMIDTLVKNKMAVVDGVKLRWTGEIEENKNREDGNE